MTRRPVSVRVLVGVVAGLVAMAASSRVGIAQGDPFIGTWELNVAKSTVSQGPPPKSATRTFEVAGQGMKFTGKAADAEGKPVLVQFTASADGKDYPVTGLAEADTISVKQTDAHKQEFIEKKAGKVVVTGTGVVSPDGKVLTVATKGTNAQGQTFTNVLVFDKR